MKKETSMGTEIEIGGVIYAEEQHVEPAPSGAIPVNDATADEEVVPFARRLANWRRVVREQRREGATAGCCSAWARAYIQQRLMAEREQALRDVDIGAVRPHVPLDILDGWLVEAAWRTLGDYNEREALRCAHVLQLPDERIRRRLCGVRGRHVSLLLAKAERNLSRLLIRLGTPATIRATTSPPGCPVPTDESMLP